MQWAMLLALVGTWRDCAKTDVDPGKGDGEPHHREVPPARVVNPPPPKPVKRINLPEAVVVRALDAVRPSFIRCFERARTLDPLMGNMKVTLHLELEADGGITSVSTDTDRPKLGNCLMNVARMMKFSPPYDVAMVDVPLMF